MLKIVLIIFVSLGVILLGSAGFLLVSNPNVERGSGERVSGSTNQEITVASIYGKWRSEDKPYGDYEYFEFTPEGYTFENRFFPATYTLEDKSVTVSKVSESITFRFLNDELIERKVPRLKQIRYVRQLPPGAAE
ncbi:hypothetical protein [Motilimonas pumila]|uniref:DUF2850 domain-containing protein n=1 Tax=Motilimonas pumila TaxID=2303987 RepID=A0A418YCC0_9GAMM|nr:hypothetical protein [Motilimonas pumila]RJG42171.1 hypothetical protein D1Z90_14605 [Motilimonas pumila]